MFVRVVTGASKVARSIVAVSDTLKKAVFATVLVVAPVQVSLPRVQFASHRESKNPLVIADEAAGIVSNAVVEFDPRSV